MKTSIKQYTPGSANKFRAAHFESWLRTVDAETLDSLELNQAERDHLVKLGRQNVVAEFTADIKNLFPALTRKYKKQATPSKETLEKNRIKERAELMHQAMADGNVELQNAITRQVMAEVDRAASRDSTRFDFRASAGYVAPRRRSLRDTASASPGVTDYTGTTIQ